ncbi:MAG: WbqC family protein, partial [Bacteroidetes bacterium]|nr:WbqC family protein [Bacteroidota bacterium]
MKPIAIDLFYLPNLEFFSVLRGQEEVLLFPQARYPRQSYTNRCQLRLANGVNTLSIPIQGR